MILVTMVTKLHKFSLRMDSLLDGVVQHILSKLSNVNDVASCNCVSKKWKYLMSYHKSLYFRRGVFENLTGPQTRNSIVMEMVELVFTGWLHGC